MSQSSATVVTVDEERARQLLDALGFHNCRDRERRPVAKITGMMNDLPRLTGWLNVRPQLERLGARDREFLDHVLAILDEGGKVSAGVVDDDPEEGVGEQHDEEEESNMPKVKVRKKVMKARNAEKAEARAGAKAERKKAAVEKAERKKAAVPEAAVAEQAPRKPGRRKSAAVEESVAEAVPTKKASAGKPAKKASGADQSDGRRTISVVIRERLAAASGKKPVTRKEILAALEKEFPDRDPKGMGKTVGVEVPLLMNRRAGKKGGPLVESDGEGGFWLAKG